MALELDAEVEAKDPKTSESQSEFDWIGVGFGMDDDPGGANNIDGLPGGGNSIPVAPESVPSGRGVFRGTLILIFSPALRLRSLSGDASVVSTPLAAWSSRSHSLEVFRERCQNMIIKGNVVYSLKKLLLLVFLKGDIEIKGFVPVIECKSNISVLSLRIDDLQHKVTT